jgi:hypothetical protein
MQGSGSPTTGTADPTPCSVPNVTETVSGSKASHLNNTHALLLLPSLPQAAVLLPHRSHAVQDAAMLSPASALLRMYARPQQLHMYTWSGWKRAVLLRRCR